MSKQLPGSANLEHLKKEAKALKKSSSTKLAEAQLAVAREYGFASWAKLKRHVEGYSDLRREFFAAISAGDRDRVRELAAASPTLVREHNPDSFGQTPVAAAAGRGDIPMIDLLLASGAQIDDRSDWWAGSFGPLDFADERTSDHLLKKGAILTAHAAARLGMAQALREMIARNAGVVHERGGDGQFPLHFAKTPEIVDILADAGAELDARDIDHESTAAQWRIKETDVLRRLVERGASTDIFTAVALDDPDLVQKHLQRDPGALSRKSTEPGDPMIHDKAPGAPIYTYVIGSVRPLQAAANMGSDRAYRFLFDQSPAPQQLIAAGWKGDGDTARSLKGHLGDLTAEEMSVVSDAAKDRRHDLLRLMLELGFDVDAQDKEGMTPLHWTGFHGDAEGMRIVLAHGPSLTVRNVYGGDALGTTCHGSQHGWYAKTGDYGECVRRLLAAGADVPDKPHGSPEVLAALRDATA